MPQLRELSRSIAVCVLVFAVAGAAYGVATPSARAIAFENCADTLGLAPGPCAFGGAVISPPVPCLGTGLFMVLVAAQVAPLLPPVPIRLILAPTEFPYYITPNIGQFVLGIAQGGVGRCATSPDTLVAGIGYSGFPLVFPAAYYGTSPPLTGGVGASALFTTGGLY